MSENKMLIDAAHPEETRVVVLRSGRVEEFDYESAARKQLRGNIYLAKVTRVEPALQAAFIDYGGNRHGFLAFNEVHPDYYQIPMADRLALLEEEAAAEAEEEEEIERAAAEDEVTDETGDDEIDDDDDDDDDDEEDDDADGRVIDVHAASDDEDDDDEEEDDDDDLGNEDSSEVDAGGDATSHAAGGYRHEAPAAVADEQASNAVTSVAETPVRENNEETEPAADVVQATEAAAGPQTSATEPAGEAPEGTPADDHSTVLSEAMPRDAILTEAPALTAGEAPAAAEATSDQEATNFAAGEQIESEPAAQPNSASSDQPDYYTPIESSRERDGEPSAEASAETEPDDAGDRESRPRGRRGRQNSGRRRRGGRSRRGRPRDAEASSEEADGVDQVGNEDALEELPSRPRRTRRSYKIQEVIKRRQVLLIQVVKEERGNKGAALTTYLSLAGRYTVLMPNTARGGGISRKITNPQDRKRLKAIANELDVPEGMGLIIRTAGAARTKQEIRRDFEYLLRLWESVRELTLQSTAPALVYEEGDLIKRSIRDLYNKDVDQIVVAGDEAYRSAKSFMRMLMPSHAKNVTHYADPEPLFTRHGIERQLNAMFSPYVHLPSGGYLVINQTEALVAIDVNSGRSTREFSIEETAVNTNLEASDEIARQLKLRDLAGLIVIDYIDMEERRNNRAVERRIREALKDDRARIQIGRISPFGLLEMSRQRLRTGVLEGSTSQCAHCQGTGIIRSVESVALGVLRGLEDAVMAGARTSLIANTTAEVALYILNNKRDFVIAMENRLGMPVIIQASPKMAGANFTIEKGEAVAPVVRAPTKADAISVDSGFDSDDEFNDTDDGEAESASDDQPRGDDEGEDRGRRRRRRRRGGRRSDETSTRETDDDADHSEASDETTEDADEEASAAGRSEEESGEEKSGRRRRRGRRGGRRNRGRNRDGEAGDSDGLAAEAGDDDGSSDNEPVASSGDDEARMEANEPRAANDDEPEVDAKPAATAAAAASGAAALATPISIGTSKADTDSGALAANAGEPDEATMEDAVARVEESPADETATAVSIAAATPVDTDGGADSAASKTQAEEEADPEAPRRPRGEPVSSEPRLARITVSPEGPEAGQQAPTETESIGKSTAAKPTRRGWWQRKLLGDA